MLAWLTTLGGWLAKVPFIGKVLSFLVSKSRLVIEYALIGVLIAVAGFTVALWMEKVKVEDTLCNVQQRLTTVEVSSAIQDETIANLKELRTRDAQAISGLLEDYTFLAKHDKAAEARLTQLEKSNATVRAYLNTSIPPELVCLLNNTCSPKDNSEAGAAAAP